MFSCITTLCESVHVCDYHILQNRKMPLDTKLTIVGVVLLIPFVFSLDFESAKERPCFEIEDVVPVDSSWEMSVKKWYFALMSRYDLYDTASVMLGKDPKDILENELYYDGCITWELTSAGTVMAHGFGGKTKEFSVKALDEKRTEFFVNGESEAICYNTLTDNKTFTFSPCCLASGQMIWSVGSSIPELPKETVKKIHDHAMSLGFKREYFTGLSFKNCKNVDAVDTDLHPPEGEERHFEL